MTLPLLQGCKSGSAADTSDMKELPVEYASLLSMYETDGAVLVRMTNPWDTTKYLHSYLLVDSGRPVPSGFPEATVVRVPVRRSVTYSVVHTSLFDEFGEGRSVVGVCDARWFNKGDISVRLDRGEVADCGNSLAPDVERILTIRPDAVFASPFENSGGYGKLGQTGIPIIECADYMELSPLGRAEWMRFYGRLFGKGEQADSLFAATVREYDSIRKATADVKSRPSVMFDRIYGSSWSVPGAFSPVGRLIEDAGGTNIFAADHPVNGSVPMAPEKVVYQAKDADIWIIRYNDPLGPMTLESLGKENALYRRVAPYVSGNVYGVNTDIVPYYTDVPFHPQWILADLQAIFHPELQVTDTLRYFSKIQP